MNAPLKVQPHHLERGAYLYIRQSSMRQVVENVESTKRQYALRGRAIALGWRDEQIIVIDNDQGESGASAAWREGFQRLVTDVGMGHAGIVMGLEVSRLARNNADWQRLLEICALADTLILDEDGVYDPASFNDRLLLGLKGTMSEAELHVIKARLRGGILNKASAASIRCPLPTAWSMTRPAMSCSIRTHRSGRRSPISSRRSRASAPRHQTVKAFRKEGLLFPSRLHNSETVFPAADGIDGDAHAEQSALRGRLRLRPATVPAHPRGQEDRARPSATTTGLPAFPMPIPATSVGSSFRRI